MHEYSIVQALLEKVEAEARSRSATAVHGLRLRVGDLSGVEIDLLRSAFEVFRRGSICGDAELEIETVTARWSCPLCDREIERGGILRCPGCGGPARLAGGDEIVLERIEMEVP